MNYENYRFLVSKWGQERTDKTFTMSIAAMVRALRKKYGESV